jgi:anti-sigma-K factor RskA
MTDTSLNEDDINLAAEYALGLLDGEDARLVEARLNLDEDLKAEVVRWQEHFATLADEVALVEPPARLKGVIERKIYGVPVTKAGFSFLRFLTIGGAVAMLAVTVLWFALNRDTGDYAALLADAGRGLQVEAVFDQDSGTLDVARLSGPELPGRAVELWLIADGAAPVSLGLVPSAGGASVTLPADLAAKFATATLAISDEPEGGSPTGQPTGAVLATAVVQEI